MSNSPSILEKLKTLIWRAQQAGLVDKMAMKGVKKRSSAEIKPGAGHRLSLQPMIDESKYGASRSEECLLFWIADAKPHLVAFELRYELENRLKQIAKERGIPLNSRTKVTEHIVPGLLHRKVVSAEQAHVIQELYSQLSEVIHGRPVTTDFAEHVLSVRGEILDSLDRISSGSNPNWAAT